MKKIKCLIGLFLVLFLAGCGTKEEVFKVTKEYEVTDVATNYALIEMETGDQMLLELYPDIAPITVKNFQDLILEEFYDGLVFHRIMADFMIQGGDPLGNGTGGAENSIKGEFEINGVDNELSHTRGIISMARKGPNYGEPETSATMDSATSQFFIVHENSPHLDGSYAAFGKLIDGFDTLDKMAKTKVGADGQTPVNKPVIKTIRMVSVIVKTQD